MLVPHQARVNNVFFLNELLGISGDLFLEQERDAVIALHNPRLCKLGNYVASLCRCVVQSCWIYLQTPNPKQKYRVGEFGGRVFYASSGDDFVVYDTCVVVDICQWSDDMTICTKNRFPEAEVSIVHSTTSLTGFSVVMRIQPAHHHRQDEKKKWWCLRMAHWTLWLPVRILKACQRSNIAGGVVAAGILWAAYEITERIKKGSKD